MSLSPSTIAKRIPPATSAAPDDPHRDGSRLVRAGDPIEYTARAIHHTGLGELLVGTYVDDGARIAMGTGGGEIVFLDTDELAGRPIVLHEATTPRDEPP